MIRMIKLMKIRLAGHVAHMEEKRNAYKISVGKPAGTMSLGRHRHKWANNIKKDHRELE
jgi:hypothetical protein